jgi:hypothetical protein
MASLSIKEIIIKHFFISFLLLGVRCYRLFVAVTYGCSIISYGGSSYLPSSSKLAYASSYAFKLFITIATRAFVIMSCGLYLWLYVVLLYVAVRECSKHAPICLLQTIQFMLQVMPLYCS